MDIKNFYSFGSNILSSTFQAGAQGLKNLDVGLDSDRLLMGNFTDINFPVVFKRDYGWKLCDMLDTGDVSLFLISDKMLTILKENNFTGWKIYPIRLFDEKGNEIYGYNGFSVIGKCDAKTKYRKDSLFEKRLITNGPLSKFYKGLHIDFTKWDGSDFFIPKGSLRIVITQNAQEIISKHKLTNVKIRNIKDIEVPDFIVKKEELI